MSDAEQPPGELGRVFEPAKVLIRFEENVLAQVHGVFPLPYELQYVIEDTLLPPGNEQVVGVNIAIPRFPDQIPVFDFAKDQGLGATPLSPIIKTPAARKKLVLKRRCDVGRAVGGLLGGHAHEHPDRHEETYTYQHPHFRATEAILQFGGNEDSRAPTHEPRAANLAALEIATKKLQPRFQNASAAALADT